MKGLVDDRLRALLQVPVSASRDGDRSAILAWIDTAFNGGLVIARKQIAELGLVRESSMADEFNRMPSGPVAGSRRPTLVGRC